MVTVAVVYQSGGGHTRVLAEEIERGVRSVEKVQVNLINIKGEQVVKGRWDDPQIMNMLDDSDAIIFGCATYMGSVSAIFKAFLEKAFDPWTEQRWKDKIAGGFTNSSSQSGDKLCSLFQLVIFAMQMNMLWIGIGDPPGNNWSGGRVSDINRLGAWLGAMGQSNIDQESDVAPSAGDRVTALRYGTRIALIARKWKDGGEYITEPMSDVEVRRINEEFQKRSNA